MQKLKVAFATDNGKTFMGRHFGDADYYHIYEIDENNSELINIIKNTTEEEDIHADPKKAGSIAKLLKQENVQIVVSKIFGPNIKRIKKKFVCILMKQNSIENGIDVIKTNFLTIAEEWEIGENRKHLSL
ncbi:MAG: hypothetical protein B1H06_00280 [Candidatus Cloacimonas sp. 4484_143]|nr:MAG: hypothetical protein B1H06_00280 [Candidatus Cloacimonas sp. 4484_143]RLC49606.1 MAG: dinitrogenase iron-molybdenum cofactor biosynthesis protein [Candidatus Cloacimonadota bacterium]RLC58031.1 MAG: dinitrogenase iron-molybdenum cofactor biosynthesis protein [Candidatus Cloacimonadota bacterium]